jgi:hypothetical protein
MKAHFDLAGANRLLPLLRSIAAEVDERRTERRRLNRLREELESAQTPEGTAQALDAIDAQLAENAAAVRVALAEFEQLGLTVLRSAPLTIHIPGRTQRGPVVFCWQSGEEGITHGHPVGEEEDPRRPLRLRSADGEAAA